jgi:hypothetical protein
LTQVIAEAEIEWCRLRGLLRYAILAGDVQPHGSTWETPNRGNYTGLDTNRRLDYLDVVRALLLLDEKDELAHELLRRDVGAHCADEKCRRVDDGPGHWHRISWADLFNRFSKGILQDRLDAAREYVVSSCNGDLARVDTVVYNQDTVA